MGMWELAVNKHHHADHDVDASMKALVCQLSSANEAVHTLASHSFAGFRHYPDSTRGPNNKSPMFSLKSVVGGHLLRMNPSVTCGSG